MLEADFDVPHALKRRARHPGLSLYFSLYLAFTGA